MIVDFDDFREGEHRLDLLERLHDANPRFRCTLFAIPALGSDAFWTHVPDWCELAMHGWAHPHPREAEHWTYDQAIDTLLSVPDGFVDGFKAPGWQISEGTYQALIDLEWWVADHYENDHRRPAGMLTHRLSFGASSGADPEHWHGHIPNVCGNGIEETFEKLIGLVRAAESFELVSESVSLWQAGVPA